MFRKFNKVGDKVSVKFNVNTNEWKGKYYTTLQSWRCTKDDAQATAQETVQATTEDDLPFQEGNTIIFKQRIQNKIAYICTTK